MTERKEMSPHDTYLKAMTDYVNIRKLKERGLLSPEEADRKAADVLRIGRQAYKELTKRS